MEGRDRMTKRNILRGILALALLMALVGQFVNIPRGTHVPVVLATGTVSVTPNFGPPGQTITIQAVAGTFPNNGAVTVQFTDSAANVTQNLATGQAANDGSLASL